MTDYQTMTKQQLIEIARQNGAHVKLGMSKPQIISNIRAQEIMRARATAKAAALTEILKTW